jgi:hypothetical protein
MTYFSGAGSGDTFAGAATGSCCSDGGRVPGRSPRRVRTSNLEGMRERSLILAIRREIRGVTAGRGVIPWQLPCDLF